MSVRTGKQDSDSREEMPVKVTTAKTAGFCFGVRRAVDEVHRQIASGEKPVYTYGPIIHNDQVVAGLEEQGVRVIRGEEDLAEITGGTVIIRSHGVSRAVQEKLEATGLHVVDATCPFVKKIHRIVQESGKAGKTVIIAGDPDHPEVQGICGWTEGPYFVVQNADEIGKLCIPEGQKAVLVAQTTFNAGKFEEIVEIFKKTYYYDTVINTVCSATDERQTEARMTARQVDAMIVIGGRHSSNTRKLYEICSCECKNTYFIETLVDLDFQPFQSFSHVGITAGASTPNSIIEEVQEHVRRIKF